MEQEKGFEHSFQKIDSFLSECRNEIEPLEESIKRLKEMKISLDEKRNKIKPFFFDIGPDLKRLNELKRLRALLIKLDGLKKIHQSLVSFSQSRVKQKSDAEARLIKSIEMFQQLRDEWKRLEKVKSRNAYKMYLKEIIIYWSDILKQKMIPLFESCFKSISWPVITNHSSQSTQLSLPQEVANDFQLYFSSLLTLDIEKLLADSDVIQESEQSDKSINFIYVCLSLQLMIKPLKKRFVYHFMGNLKTNQLSKVRD